MASFCERCKHRDNCREICPAAERYSCKDFVSLRERYSPDPGFFINQTSSAWERIQENAYTPMNDFDFLKRIENDLLQAVYYEGLSYAEAARRFQMKLSAVDAMLVRIRKKIARNLYL